MRKHLLVFGLLLSGVGLLSGCQSSGKITTLSTPTNLVVENNYITFDEVANASYYLINYNGNTFKVQPSNSGEIVFDANKIFTDLNTYEVKVKAIGGKKYADSGYSKTVSYSTYHGLQAPASLTINGKTLSWSSVDNTNFYTVKIAFPNGNIGYYEY